MSEESDREISFRFTIASACICIILIAFMLICWGATRNAREYNLASKYNIENAAVIAWEVKPSDEVIILTLDAKLTVGKIATKNQNKIVIERDGIDKTIYTKDIVSIRVKK